MQIQFQIEGITELNRKLSGIADRIKDWGPTTKKIGSYLKGFFTNDVFESEGSVFGEKWVGGKYYHKLQVSGTMRHGFWSKSDKNQVEIGNSAPYFIYHQSNQPRNSKLPRRIMMKLDEKRKQNIVRYFVEQINIEKKK